MALTSALFAGVSGINSNGNAMNIIGDNIANANTIGFKSSRAVFFDLLSADVGGTKIGLGSRLAARSGVRSRRRRDDRTAPPIWRFRAADCLFSRMRGRPFYSRAGQFSIDKDGNLANPAGLAVQGVQLDPSGNPISGLTNIVISQLVVASTPITDDIGNRRESGCDIDHADRGDAGGCRRHPAIPRALGLPARIFQPW